MISEKDFLIAELQEEVNLKEEELEKKEEKISAGEKKVAVQKKELLSLMESARMILTNDE